MSLWDLTSHESFINYCENVIKCLEIMQVFPTDCSPARTTTILYNLIENGTFEIEIVGLLVIL